MFPDTFFAVVLLVAGAVPCSVDAAEVVDVGDRNQVFVDGRYLASKKNVSIVVCRPTKTNEKCLRGNLGGYSSIMTPDGVFRGFHALTKDGIKWRRVTVGTMPEPDDVLGILFDEATVFVDPKAPVSERYKKFSGLQNRIWASADGAQWKALHDNVFPQAVCYPLGMDSQNVCFFDTRLGEYTAFVRVNKVYECPPERVSYFGAVGEWKHGAENRYSRRTIGRSTARDLSHFPMPTIVMEPDEKDPVFGGVKVMDFYCPQVVQYPYAQDAYFLFNCRYLEYHDWYLPIDMSQYPRGVIVGENGKKDRPGIHNCGVEDIELDASRDGIHWDRYDRKPWIAQGPSGSFDSLTMYMTRGLFLHGDQIWMYYIGLDDPHTGKESVQDHYTLSRVVLRKDGFTCVEASYAGGEFTTTPLRFDGHQLSLNIETSALGLARVEIQDALGNPLPGYTMDECDRVHAANSVHRVVSWRGVSDVSKLSTKTVRLRFELQFGAKLYAFRFIPAAAGAKTVSGVDEKAVTRDTFFTPSGSRTLL
jgi:hypothetical protein